MRKLVASLAFLLLAGSLSAGPLTEARINKIVNDVTVVDPSSGVRKAALQEVIRDDIGVKTGVKSRSELLFQDNTLTRLGPESCFSFKPGTREMSLEKGAMLLQVPKGLGGAKIRTAAVSAAITGTTIMLEHVPGKLLKVLVLEGSLRLSVNGTFGDSLLLLPGKMVIMNPLDRRIPDPVTVDLARVVKTSSLVQMTDADEKAALPSMPLIDAEIDKQSKEKGDDRLRDTNLVILGGGNQVLLAPDTLLAALDKKENADPFPPAPIPQPSATVPPPGGGATATPTPVAEPTPEPTPIVNPTPNSNPAPIATPPIIGGGPSPTPGPGGGPAPTPAPFVVGNGTVILTGNNPTLTVNGTVNLGAVYRGNSTSGSASAFFFGSNSAFDEMSDFDNRFGEHVGSGGVSVFRFNSLQLTSLPTFTIANSGRAVAFISNGALTATAPGGSLNTSGIRSLFLGTVNGNITLAPTWNLSFTSGSEFQYLQLYARGGDAVVNGSINFPDRDLFLDAEHTAIIGYPATVTVRKTIINGRDGVQVNGSVMADFFQLSSSGQVTINGSVNAEDTFVFGSVAVVNGILSGKKMTFNTTGDFLGGGPNGLIDAEELTFNIGGTLSLNANNYNFTRVDQTGLRKVKINASGVAFLSDYINTVDDVEFNVGRGGIVAPGNVSGFKDVNITAGLITARSFAAKKITFTESPALLGLNSVVVADEMIATMAGDLNLGGAGSLLTVKKLTLTATGLIRLNALDPNFARLNLAALTSLDLAANGFVFLSDFALTTVSPDLKPGSGGISAAGFNLSGFKDVEVTNAQLVARSLSANKITVTTTGANDLALAASLNAPTVKLTAGRNLLPGAAGVMISARDLTLEANGLLYLNALDPSFARIDLPMLTALKLTANGFVFLSDFALATVSPDLKPGSGGISAAGLNLSGFKDVELTNAQLVARSLSANKITVTTTGANDLALAASLNAPTIKLTAGRDLLPGAAGVMISARDLTLEANGLLYLNALDPSFARIDLPMLTALKLTANGFVFLSDFALTNSGTDLKPGSGGISAAGFNLSGFKDVEVTNAQLVARSLSANKITVTTTGANDLALAASLNAPTIKLTAGRDLLPGAANFTLSGADITLKAGGTVYLQTAGGNFSFANLGGLTVQAPRFSFGPGAALTAKNFFNFTTTGSANDLILERSLNAPTVALQAGRDLHLNGVVSARNVTLSAGRNLYLDAAQLDLLQLQTMSLSGIKFIFTSDFALNPATASVDLRPGSGGIDAAGFQLAGFDDVVLTNAPLLALSVSARNISLTTTGNTQLVLNATLIAPTISLQAGGNLNLGNADRLISSANLTLSSGATLNLNALASGMARIDLNALQTLTLVGQTFAFASDFALLPGTSGVDLRPGSGGIQAAGFNLSGFDDVVLTNAPLVAQSVSANNINLITTGGNALALNASLIAPTVTLQAGGNVTGGAGALISAQNLSITAGGSVSLNLTDPALARINLNGLGTLNVNAGTILIPLDFALGSTTGNLTGGAGGIVATTSQLSGFNSIVTGAGGLRALSLSANTLQSNSGSAVVVTNDLALALSATFNGTASIGGMLSAPTITSGSSLIAGALVTNILQTNGAVTASVVQPFTIGSVHTLNFGSLVASGGLQFNGTNGSATQAARRGENATVASNSLLLDATAINGARFNGGDATAAANPFGGDGGTATFTANGALTINADVEATSGQNLHAGLTGGQGGTVNLTSNSGAITINARVEASSDDGNRRKSASGGQINIASSVTNANATAITVTNSGQLLALLNNTASGAGGRITFTSAGGAINVAGTVKADRGSIEMTNNGRDGAINLTNANLHADAVKISALGRDGTLTVGGGTISADSLISLYAGGSNGSVNFVDNVTLTGNSVKNISGNTVTILNGKTVTVNGPTPANIFTNVPNYSGFGGNNSTTGTFGGQGATTQVLSASPGPGR